MSDTNKDGVTDITEAVAGGAEFTKAQQEQAAAEAKAEAERAAAAPVKYPAEFSPHTRWVDDAVAPPVEFIGTQYTYNTEAEALAAIEEARAADKYVMYMDPAGASYVAEANGGYTITVED